MLRFWDFTEQAIKKMGFRYGVYFYQVRTLKNPPPLSLLKRNGMLMPGPWEEERMHSKAKENPFQGRIDTDRAENNPMINGICILKPSIYILKYFFKVKSNFMRFL